MCYLQQVVISCWKSSFHIQGVVLVYLLVWLGADPLIYWQNWQELSIGLFPLWIRAMCTLSLWMSWMFYTNITFQLYENKYKGSWINALDSLIATFPSVVSGHFKVNLRVGGLGVTWSPRDLRLVGSNPAEVDGFFQDVKILSTSPPGRIPSVRF